MDESFIARCKERVLHLLVGIIDAGQSAPLNREIGDMLDVSESTARTCLRELRRDGIIKIEMVAGGRRIGIGDRWTGWTRQPSRKMPTPEPRRLDRMGIALGGFRFDDNYTGPEILRAGPKLPPLNHSPAGCALR